jgi:hypothetical protein
MAHTVVQADRGILCASRLLPQLAATVLGRRMGAKFSTSTSGWRTRRCTMPRRSSNWYEAARRPRDRATELDHTDVGKRQRARLIRIVRALVDAGLPSA